ncbi:hypothetical protein ACLMJK_007793 [Lecanora helva]
MPPTNLAAYLPHEKAPSLSIQPAPYTPPGENEITIANHAVAINPIDWAIQSMGSALYKLSYPFIGGVDVAGEVVETGPNVTRFRIGDRVLGHALLFAKPGKGAAFQLYTVLATNMCCVMPAGLEYERAAVLPLGVSTASSALFQSTHLGLEYPSISPRPTGKTVLVWGGSSSVGSCAIQLATASGYEVFTTCSPRNFEHVKSLGAKRCFDYHDGGVVQKIVDDLKGNDFAGAMAIGSASSGGNGISTGEACLEIVDKTPGRKFVSVVSSGVPDKVPEGVDAKFVFGSELKDNEVSHSIYGDFLPKALAQGSFVAKPDPEVVGKGLESIQMALGVQKRGVSARKVVVSL